MNLIGPQPVTPDGKPIIAPSLVYVDASGLVKGQRCICVADSTNIFDYQLTVNTALQGVHAIIVDAKDGDYGEFSVVDKDDVLGLFDYYGIPEGGVLELKKFGETIYVPDGKTQIAFEFQSAYELPIGLYLRLTWESTDTTTGPKIYPDYKLYRG